MPEEDEIKKAVLEEIRKSVVVRSFRFLKHDQQIKIIAKAIERGIKCLTPS